MNSHDIREEFLKRFVVSLIINSKKNTNLAFKTESRINNPVFPEKKQESYILPERGSIAEKIFEIIKIPGVERIECSGPEEKLLVRKMGKSFLHKLTLKEKEIKKFFEEFSKISGASVKNGLINAVYENTRLIGVTSKFAGSRFVLEKLPEDYV